MHVLIIIITCTFLAELEVHENKFGSSMGTRVMGDDQGSYNHEEEVQGLHFNMGKAEIESNGRRGRHELVTMRNMHREVQSYRANNERIVKAQKEILQSLNMLHKKVNKDSCIKQEAIAREVTTSRSHSRKDDHGNDRQSRSMSRCHHSPMKSTRRTHASSGPGSIPSVLLGSKGEYLR
jgi:hypothetical protein